MGETEREAVSLRTEYWPSAVSPLAPDVCITTEFSPSFRILSVRVNLCPVSAVGMCMCTAQKQQQPLAGPRDQCVGYTVKPRYEYI